MEIQGLQKMTLLDYPGHVSCTVFLSGCNFLCPFCHNSELLDPETPGEMNDEGLLRFLETRKGILDGVAFTGGEPLLRKGTLDLLKKIKELGYPIKLDTNGSFPERLKEAVKTGLVDYVAMDIKNSPALYAATSGLPDMGYVSKAEGECLIGQGEAELLSPENDGSRNTPAEQKSENTGAISDKTIQLVPLTGGSGYAKKGSLLAKVEESKNFLMKAERGEVPSAPGFQYEFRTTTVAQLHSEESFRAIGPWIQGASQYFLQVFTDRDTVPFAGLTAPAEEDMLSYEALVKPFVRKVAIRGLK